jgi:hypothetical protein
LDSWNGSKGILVAGGTVRFVARKGLPTPIWLGKLPLNGELKSRGTPCPVCLVRLSHWPSFAFCSLPVPSSRLYYTLPLQIIVAQSRLRRRPKFRKCPVWCTRRRQPQQRVKKSCITVLQIAGFPCRALLATADGAIRLWGASIPIEFRISRFTMQSWHPTDVFTTNRWPALSSPMHADLPFWRTEYTRITNGSQSRIAK